MDKILIFGGTSEGRRLVEYFCRLPVEIHVSVATEYGERLLEGQKDNVTVFQGRLNEQQMVRQMKQEGYTLVIDATHPYAQECSRNIKQACSEASVEYCRVARSTESEEKYFESLEEASLYLEKKEGNILVTTGSKELPVFLKNNALFPRVYARILPSAPIIQQCMEEYHMEGSHIFAMQGPFSLEMNVALLKHCNAKFLVTKASGAVGGFFEKLQSARAVGAEPIIIGMTLEDTGFSYKECITYVCKKLDLHVKPQVTLIGIGMGCQTLTEEAKAALQTSDCIIGARRMLEAVSAYGKDTYIATRPEEIITFIEDNPQYQQIGVVLSGDIGFYSGAKKLWERLKSYEVKNISGISSLAYFMARLQMSWEDVRIISIHGVQNNLAGHIQREKKCFALLSNGSDINQLCKELCSRGLKNVTLYVGENLSYSHEKITVGKPEELCNCTFAPLSVLLVINENASCQEVRSIPDREFCRDKVPMTKREIRTVSLSYLGLQERDVFYDIGAGTGSVSVEGALHCPLGEVYAIEKKKEAISLLEKNKEKFGLGNITILEGEAPACLKGLPPADKVFIGGSSGKIEEILQGVLSKNPFAEIVLNVITLESLSSAVTSFAKLGIMEKEITEITLAKSERVGGLHMMKGENPIYVISGRGSGKICTFPE